MATITAILVTPEDGATFVEIENDLPAFQEAVGGWIEGVYFDGYMMYVNEDGIAQRLTPNPLASRHCMMVQKRPITIFGNALLVGDEDENGDHLSIDKSVMEFY